MGFEQSGFSCFNLLQALFYSFGLFYFLFFIFYFIASYNVDVFVDTWFPSIVGEKFEVFGRQDYHGTTFYNAWFCRSSKLLVFYNGFRNCLLFILSCSLWLMRIFCRRWSYCRLISLNHWGFLNYYSLIYMI